MVKSVKKAFTLVELIVVITILAILGTIAFISLQGYSAEARDSKRLTNINDLTRKINIEIVKGTEPNLLIMTGGTSVMSWAVSRELHATTPDAVYAAMTEIRDAAQGIVNFGAIRENRDNFRDPSVVTGAEKSPNDYPFAYAIGWTGTWAYNFLQMGTIVEAKNQNRLVWNYYQIDATDDPKSLIEGTDGNTAEDAALRSIY